MELIRTSANTLLSALVVFSCNCGATADAQDRHLTVAISGDAFKKSDDGATMPASSKGKLTAQLFNGEGAGDPIWTEVTHDEITFPDDNGVAIVLVLGRRTELVNPATSLPIQLKDSPWLLLTLQVDGTIYHSKRLALLVAGFAHQATEAYEATGNLKRIIDDYEMRIKTLETTLAAREQELKNLRTGFLKLRFEVNGKPITEPVEN